VIQAAFPAAVGILAAVVLQETGSPVRHCVGERGERWET
jgi:hypothetical protein